jgi:hypothetical protein
MGLTSPSVTAVKFDVLENVQHVSDAGQTVVPAPTVQESRLASQRAARIKSSERKHRLTWADRQWFKVRIPGFQFASQTDSSL